MEPNEYAENRGGGGERNAHKNLRIAESPVTILNLPNMGI